MLGVVSSIRAAFAKLFLDKAIFGLAITGFSILTLILGLAFFRVRPSAIEIPLGFNSYLKVDNLGSWYQIFYLPAFGLVCIMANLALVINPDTSRRLAQYLLLATNLILILILVIVINLTSLTFIR
ncbi:hypothetical protein KC853_02895 [Candidatus Saccharibacteria bacterium]|nr:hypothetical protein [Candidatus Saccharibacteria bacterium]MCB9834619.1 hypothetical protein [Candidatus Nomurabacteria bacterium]